MDDRLYTTGDLVNIYRWQGTKNAFVSAENQGSIPSAKRGGKRSAQSRVWTQRDLPEIGAKFGFINLEGVTDTITIATYSGKGGVTKTSSSYFLARTLALHGINTLVIGLDVQGSLTELALRPTENLSTLEDFEDYLSIADALTGKDTIKHTDLPTLDVIPENTTLSETSITLASKSMRHSLFNKKLMSNLKKKYQVIIFDNSPSWSSLVENSVFASDYVLMPAAANIGCYQVLENNLNVLYDFLETTGKDLKRIFLVPTLLESNKISKQVHAAYVSQYSDICTAASIRRTVKGSECFALGISPQEHSPKSPLADDYIDLAKEIIAEVKKHGS